MGDLVRELSAPYFYLINPFPTKKRFFIIWRPSMVQNHCAPAAALSLDAGQRDFMATATAMAAAQNAFSISFEFTSQSVKSMVYLKPPSPDKPPKSPDLRTQPDECMRVPPVRVASPSSPVAPEKPREEQCESATTAQASIKKSVPKEARAAKGDALRKHAVSARGSGTPLSDAAIAAQARADAAKGKKSGDKRPRAARPAREPAQPSQRAHALPCVPGVSDEEMQQLDDVAARHGFEMPTTPEKAEMFLDAIMGVRLWESDGVGRAGALRNVQVRRATQRNAAYTAWHARAQPPFLPLLTGS